MFIVGSYSSVWCVVGCDGWVMINLKCVLLFVWIGMICGVVGVFLGEKVMGFLVSVDVWVGSEIV